MGDINELKQKGTKTMANLPGSIKNLNTLLGEQLLEGEGGGGSSDFSTAMVTVTKSAGKNLFMPYIVDNGYSTIAPIISSSGEYTAVLYKGNCSAMAIDMNNPLSEPTVSVTGNATTEGAEITITGDCTITIS